MTPSATSEIQAKQPGAPPAAAPLDRWLLPLLGVLSLVASCIVYSLKKQEWADEVFTRIEVSDRSLFHLMHALTRLGGAGMPLFYLAVWPWAHVFGVSDLSLRLFSCAGVCAAFLVLVRALSRRFTARAGFLGAGFGMFACMIVVDQNAEARGYGLYLLLCALAIAQLLRIAETSRPSTRDLTLLALSQAGVVLGHVLGLFYAGLMVAALIAADLRERRFRVKAYACAMAGWLLLLPWMPAIRASMAIAKPHGWIGKPSAGDLAIGLSYWLFAGIYFPLLHATHFGVILGWGAGVFCVAGLIAAALYGIRDPSPARRLAYFLGFALILAPLVLFIVSYVVTPIWVARYMVPSTLGIALLAAGWAERNRFARGAGGVLLGVLILLLPPAGALCARPQSLNVARIDAVAAGRPLVCDDIHDFTVMWRYSATPSAVEYPMDWATALKGPPASTGAYHLLWNYRRDGYLTGNILDEPAVLSQPSFLVLEGNDDNWFQLEIASNPKLVWRVLAQVGATRRIVEVDRRD
jgi:Dolichyl-phosphate-mannose-protein mannosyltransferase